MLSEPGPSPACHEAASPRVLLRVLLLLRPFAVLAVLATLLGRLAGPSAVGIGVGLDRVTESLDFLGSALSQLYGLAASAMLVAQAWALQHTRAPVYVRIAAVLLGGFIVLLSTAASALRLSAPWFALLSASAALLALSSAASAEARPHTRGPRIVVGAIGVAALVRLAGMPVAFLAGERASAVLVKAARAGATVSFALEVMAVVLAATWITARAKRLATPATLISAVAAFMGTREALRAGADGAGPAALFLRLSAERLIGRPQPMVPQAVQIFVAFFAVAAAVSSVAERRLVPSLGACVALALLSRGTPEVPLCALSLATAALGLALSARDERSLWKALAAEEREPRDKARDG